MIWKSALYYPCYSALKTLILELEYFVVHVYTVVVWSLYILRVNLCTFYFYSFTN